jgi:microcystin-dependent protein
MMRKKLCFGSSLLAMFLVLSSQIVMAGSDANVGDILWVASSVVPDGYKSCEGQLLATTEYPEFFAKVSNNFGGDGSVNYALPDARGRALFHAGASAGLGLTQRILAGKGGAEAEAMSIEHMPPHKHIFKAVNQPSDTNIPFKNALSQFENGFSSSLGAPDSTLIEGSVSYTGNGNAANNMSPFTAMYCIVRVASVVKDS